MSNPNSGRVRAAKRKLSSAWRSPKLERLEPRLALSSNPFVHVAAKAAAAASSVSLTPTADTYVYAANQYANYGNTNFLAVQNDSSRFSSDDAESYLRFSTASLGNAPIAKAVLTLTPIGLGSAAQSLTVGVQMLKSGDDTSWVQGSGGMNTASTGPATWYNTPYGAGSVATAAGSQLAVGTPLSIDVTALLNQNINTSGIESFILGAVSRVGRNELVEFASTSYATAGYWPTLTITTAGPVVPPPTVATQPTSSSVTSTSAQLAVLGSDGGSDTNLVYTWSLSSGPSGAAAPTFAFNGTNASKNTSVTFHQAGSYTFVATITNTSDGLSTVSKSVTVTIGQTLTGILVTPSTTTVAAGSTLQFSATGVDQFGQTYSGSIGAVTWSMTGAGTVNSSSGLYTAPATLGTTKTATITAKAAAGTATSSLTLSTAFDGILNPALSTLTQSLDADGSISRTDVIQILRAAETLGGTISQGVMTDLKTLLSDASQLNMPGYVQVLAGDIINGNAANAHYQGQSLGNLAVGSSATTLDELIGKWFLGTDVPNSGGYGYSTINVTGSIFATAPSHLNEDQGELGDCYLISSLGTIADSNPAAIENMIIDNGVDATTGLHTWTVRFYNGSTPDYVTVDNKLPTSGGTLVFDGYGEGTTNPAGLWIALIEKAYAQWNETGKEGRSGTNTYSAIEGGWMADVDAQVLGHSASSYNVSSSSDLQALIAGMTNHQAVTIGTKTSNNANDTLSYGLFGSHAYAVVGYNAANQTFTLYNPWGIDQPTQALSWSQLESTMDGFVVANASGSQSFAASAISPRPAIAPRPTGDIAVASAASSDNAVSSSNDQDTVAHDAVLAETAQSEGEAASGSSAEASQSAVNSSIDAALQSLDSSLLVAGDSSATQQNDIPANLRAAAVDSVFAMI